MNPEQSPLLGSAEKINEFFVEPFTAELENEVVTRNTPEQMANLIKLYISRLMKSKNHRPILDSHLDNEASIPEIDKNESQSNNTWANGMMVMDIPHNPGT